MLLSLSLEGRDGEGFLKPMGRWDITAWYIVNDQMVNELIFDILDYRKKSPVSAKVV